tara:strand:- start:265 stop:1065 length:801 start_codon:yes stop_codon:yes gene_type:complete
LNECIEVNIYNFKILASNKKNHTSHGLIKKCHFDDEHELSTIKKFSKNNKIFLLDCGCNYGFYSFYTASLSNDNFVVSIEASPNTSANFNKNLTLNKLSNIILKNLAISNKDNEAVTLNESHNDWESSLNHNNFEDKKLTKINTMTIETILKTHDLKDYFLFIKLDIEGHELKAIEGGLNIIKKYEPIIIIEFSKYIFDHDSNGINFLKNFLKEYDYSIYGTNKQEISVDKIITSLINLKKKYKTIGNYYLIKNNEKMKFFFLNNE